MSTFKGWVIGISVAAAVLAACKGQPEEEQTLIGPRMRTTAALRSFGSCAELEDALKSNYAEQMRVRLLQIGEGDVYYATDDMAEEADGGAAPAADRQEGVDFSGTNNQEQGVDEADFVKTDGNFIYVVNGTRLEIFGVPQFGDLVHSSTTELEGYPFQMLLAQDHAIVFSAVYGWDVDPESPAARLLSGDAAVDYVPPSLTKVSVVEVADRAAPRVVRELYIDAFYETAREVNNTVRAATYASFEIPGLLYYPEFQYGGGVDEPAAEPNGGAGFSGLFDFLDDEEHSTRETLAEAVRRAIAHNDAVIAEADLDDFVPAIYENLGGELVRRAFTESDCSSFAIADDGAGHGVTSILTLRLLDEVFTFEADHVVTNYSFIYASADALFVVEPAQEIWWYWSTEGFEEATNIHRFAFDTGATTYTGSGRVNGTVSDSFALSEHDGVLRVVSAVGTWQRWWDDDASEPNNFLFTLVGDAQLEVAGSVGDIGVGEQIWATRFDADRAYVVTFRNIDPLWTIDVSDPTQPRIIGELEVPGVSTYIHVVDDAHLLTVGYGGSDAGLDWQPELSLFDVSDFAAPALASDLRLITDPETWGSSAATYEHKAFQFWAPRGLLAVPVSASRFVEDAATYYYEYLSTLQLVRVDTTAGLSVYGSIDHSDFLNGSAGGEPWFYYYGTPEIRRSIFMGDFIYTVSDFGITAHNLDTLQETARVALEGPEYTYGYYY